MSVGREGRLIVRAARAVLAALFFAGFAAGGVLMGFLLFPLLPFVGRGDAGRRRMRGCVRAAYRLFVWAARVTGLFRVEASPEDMRLVASSRGRVVVANHVSLIDVVLLMSVLPDSTAVAKVAASRNPFYSRVVRSAFIVNDDPAGVLSAASDLLAAGVDVIVFPEGTRTSSGVKRRLHRGAAQIALRAGARIMCVSISCDPQVLAKGQAWWDVGARTVRYGLKVRGEIVPPPIETGASTHSAAAALTAEMARMLWGAEEVA